MKRNKLLAIVGPTASGKSALAVEIARALNGEIISADSRQIYRGLDIGTGKITKRDMRGVPHHLIDIASPKKAVTAYEFAEGARKAAREISLRGRLPIVAGGTGFYIDSLLGRVSLPDVPPDAPLRIRLQKKSAAQLFALLKRRDPRRAKRMNTPSERNNKFRLIRAIEIASSPAKDGTSHTRSAKDRPLYDVMWIGMQRPQKELDCLIAARLTVRIRRGMIAEGKRLHARGLSYKRMEQLGLEYRSLSRLLQKKITRVEFEHELLRDIRRYAKKQLAYWKRNSDIRLYNPRQRRQIARDVAAWLQAGLT